MGCCNILTGYAPPHTPPSLNDFPIYIDRLHKEVWYWTGTAWETIWQVSIATDTTAGVVKVSRTSPITIDAEGFLGIDCARLKAQCNFLTKAELDAAIDLLRTQFVAEINRLDKRIDAIITSIGTILTRLTIVEGKVGDIITRVTSLETKVTDIITRVTILETKVTDLGNRITIVETKVIDLGKRITIVEGDVSTIKGAITIIETKVTDLGKRITIIEGSVTDLGKRITIIETKVTDLGNRVTIVEGAVTDLSKRVTVIEGDVTTIKGAITTINTRITNLGNSSNVHDADIAALKAKDIYLEGLIKSIHPRVDYAVTSSGTAKTSIKGYTINWKVFSSPNSNIKKFSGSVCVLPSAEVDVTKGVEYVQFAVPATAIVSSSTSIGSYISPSVPTATMGFDAGVVNGNLVASFKHVMGTLDGCHGHIMCIEFI